MSVLERSSFEANFDGYALIWDELVNTMGFNVCGHAATHYVNE
jgi:hypothetical protein